MKDNRYYTAGELAGLFDIPKQTMFYYDRMGILEPEFIAENGYRYYSTTQYLTLEIILFLRKMDISVPDIRDFLKDRSKENLQNLLSDRKKKCLRQLDECKHLLHALDSYEHTLETSKNLILNQVLLQYHPSCRMYISPIPEDQRGGLSAITIRARHVREAFESCLCKEKPTGWIISQKDFIKGDFKHASSVVTRAGSCTDIPCNFIRPEGLYLSLYIKGAYFLHADKFLHQLQEFMNRNHLIPDGDLFLFPIISYWVTDDSEEYINFLSLKVRNAE